jgi:UDP-3-O-[3-hydroxymyristoyl] glucosamine N-acyltransferase
MSITLAEVANFVGCEVIGDGSTKLTGVAGIKEAREGELTFVSNPGYEKYVADTSASAVVVSRSYAAGSHNCGTSLLVADDPYDAFARVMTLFAPEGDVVSEGVHPSAVVAESATLGERVRIGANVVVMNDVTIGDGAAIHAGSFLGTSVILGHDVTIYPNVTIRNRCVLGDRVVVHSGTVIGSDGFGFALSARSHTKVPQIGNVVIEDDVEIGTNVCVDRATLGSTRICRGSKIDNLVQVAHNVVIGEGSVIVAQAGISGSTRIGKGVILAGQAGIVGHIEIGDGAMVAAQAGVTKSVPPGERVSGYPARKHSAAKRLYAFVEHLPKLVEKVKGLESRISKLEGVTERGGAAGTAGGGRTEDGCECPDEEI